MPNKAINLADPHLSALKRATVRELLDSGEVVVSLDDAPDRLLACDCLNPSQGDGFHKGDQVLVATPDLPEGRGCILGVVGSYRGASRKHLVLAADEELTIQCGKGSIRIRKDGKVLIKGLDIVSHAKGTNRIRGGSVQLN